MREYQVREVKRYVITVFERNEQRRDLYSRPVGGVISGVKQANDIAKALALAYNGKAVTLPEDGA